MSAVSDVAAVRILLADYVNADAAGKLNVVGGGIGIIGQPPAPVLGAITANSLPFGVVVSFAVPPSLYGEQCSVELVLEDHDGEPVLVPQQQPDQPPQALRVGQAITLEEPVYPGQNVPRDVMPARSQWVLMFGSGLPLAVGRAYRWRVSIDGQTRDDWTETFYVPVPPAGVVIG